MTEQAQTDAARAAEPRALRPVTQVEIDQRVFDLYDEYCHGRIDRREFLRSAAARDGRRPGDGAGAAAALRAGADDLLHRRAHQGAAT